LEFSLQAVLRPGRLKPELRTQSSPAQPKTWRFFASSRLVVRSWPNPPRRHEDAKNHEEFSISGKILAS